MKDHVVVLADTVMCPRIAESVLRANPRARIDVAASLCELERAASLLGARPLLLSFGTSVIVPGSMLDRFGGAAVNFHAASPDYPGRDPHHFAHYRGATRYGATAHLMSDKVDSGPILSVEYVDIPAGSRPIDILALANLAAMRLMDDLIPKLVTEQHIEVSRIQWATRRTTRRDFLELCRITPDMEAKEFERRRAAVAVDGYNNLYVELHGERFRIEAAHRVQTNTGSADAWRDFTETAYAALIDLAAAHYRFATFVDPGDGRRVLWRHDIDMSAHRAAKLAKIERAKGVTATYFFMVNSAFYDLVDPSVLACARRIVELGHRIGLHFSPDAYPDEAWGIDTLERRMMAERTRLEELLGCRVEAASFHNPDASGLPLPDASTLAGMVNAYGRPLRERYDYCSDSNGYWRFKPLPSILGEGRPERLHVLTHPEWWTPEPLPPRQRIERCVSGRAAAIMREYDAQLARAGRANLR